MNSRALRRLATDHATLHSQPLPPNYLFARNAPDSDDLTQLDILLAGPTHTPFAAGLFKLHLTIPPTYPSQPPTAHFRTPIFHPNVDPQTGGVCVETLKRDWDAKLTLRDILVVIGCLLIQPNPDSALNADAGGLIQQDYAAFTRRAELLTSVNAGIPRALREVVKEAQNRGREEEELEVVEGKVGGVRDFAAAAAAEPTAPVARRRKLGATARQKGTAVSRRSEGSPSGPPGARRRQQAGPSQPFIHQTESDDVFGDATTPLPQHRGERAKSGNSSVSDDSSMLLDPNQENDAERSPAKSHTHTQTHTPRAAGTPRRPPGAPVPLGELTLDSPPPSSSSESDSQMMETEYPPSPSKSPSKSVARKQQRRQQDQQHNPPANIFERGESSRDALRRGGAPNITPPANIFGERPLAADSPFATFATTTITTGGTTAASPSPRKVRALQRPVTSTPPFSVFRAQARTPGRSDGGGGIFQPKPPSSSERKRREQRKIEALNARLWKLCGGDVGRWNRCEFDGEPFGKRVGRW